MEEFHRLHKVFFWVLFIFSVAKLAEASVGVCYGRQGNNLPTAQQSVQLMLSRGITKVRLFVPDGDALAALAGTSISILVGVPNSQIFYLASSTSAASTWITTYISPYLPAASITAISVGSEVLTTSDSAAVPTLLVPAMQNLQQALENMGLNSSIKVSTPHAMGILATSFPPSAASFDPQFNDTITPLLAFLSSTGAPFMINAYPYYAYRNSMQNTALDFALLKSTASGFVDPNSGLRYTNLFDAQVDAVFYALAGLNYRNIDVLVTETGWPSMGGVDETNIVNLQNAAAFNNNLLRIALDGQGTPFRPGQNVDVYIFELFNENQKPGPTSQRNWGLFRPDGTSFYAINFAGSNPNGNGGIVLYNRTFCVASASASFGTLQMQLDSVCRQVDCRAVQPGGRCYQPDTVASHASFAFNSYFQMSGMNSNSCDFNGAAVVTTVDPSYGSCIYVGSISQYNGGASQYSRPVTTVGLLFILVWMRLV